MSDLHTATCGCGCGAEPARGRFLKGHNRRHTARLDRYVVAEDSCWNWTGPIRANGYGQVTVANESTSAHRAVWESLHGELPREIQVDHLCRNRRCVNPYHLRAVTCAQNNQAKAIAKLTTETAAAIRLADGTQRQIGAEFGVSQSLVSRIRSNRVWRPVVKP